VKLDISKIHWRRVVLAGIAAPVLAFIFLCLAVTLYVVGVAIGTGQLDSTLISKFVAQVGPSGTPIIVMFATVWSAMHVSRKAQSERTLHGFLVGSIAAVPALVIGIALAGTVDLTVLGLVVLTIAAGFIGGQMGSQEQQRNRHV
jgi:hypothetical protein